MNKSAVKANMRAFLDDCFELPFMYTDDGYDWSEFRCFYDEGTELFYWAQISGFMSEIFWDHAQSLDDFTIGSKQEFLSDARHYATTHDTDDLQLVEDAVDKLNLP